MNTLGLPSSSSGEKSPAASSPSVVVSTPTTTKNNNNNNDAGIQTRTGKTKSPDAEALRIASEMAMAVHSNPNMSIEEIQLLRETKTAASPARQALHQNKNNYAATATADGDSQQPQQHQDANTNGGKQQQQQQQQQPAKGSKAFRFDGSRLAAARAFISSGNLKHDPDDDEPPAEDPAPTTTVGTESKGGEKRRFAGIKAALGASKTDKSNTHDALDNAGAGASSGTTGGGDQTPKKSRPLIPFPGVGAKKTPPASPVLKRKEVRLAEEGIPLPNNSNDDNNDNNNNNDDDDDEATTTTSRPSSTDRQPTLYQTITSAVSNVANAVPTLPLPDGLTTLTNRNNPATNNELKVPITMTGIAWKRKGGIGKYSGTGAWELRRIELRGSRLYYYAKEESPDPPATDGRGAEGGVTDTAAAPTNDGSRSPTGNPLAVTNTATSLSSRSTGYQMPTLETAPSTDGVQVVEVAPPKPASWFEGFTNSPGDNPSAPRGCIDLCKEKANVHVAMGHSGAPSPFAISIKVRGETKWKVAFDDHKSQMEWLSALTDVVVQNSVNLYNAQLLEQLDPSNQPDAAGGVGPSNIPKLAKLASNTVVGTVHLRPPPGQDTDDNAAAGTRLWMMESYTVSSSPSARRVEAEAGDDVDTESEASDLGNDDFGGVLVRLPTADQDQEARKTAKTMSVTAWSLPEENFFYLLVIFNATIAVARSSSLPMEGFWYLIVVGHVMLYFCLTQQPDWRSILTHVRGVPYLLDDTNDKAKTDAPTGSVKSLAKSAHGARRATFKPEAGMSTVLLSNPTDAPVNEKNEVFVGWMCPPGSGSRVRSHGYLTTKEKTPSPGELYEVVQCDIVEAPVRYESMTTRVKLPKVQFENDNGPKTWRAPDIFVVTIALPTEPPKIGRSANEGGGYTITMYCRMKDETREILRRVTADDYDPSKEEHVSDVQKNKVNAVRLLEEWVRRAPMDQKWFSRFKCIPFIHNWKEVGIPGWIAKYNGKPFLIKRPGVTGFINQHPELSAFEFTVSFYPFPYLARQAICFLKEHFFQKIVASCCFVIEGRSDDELPECVIGVLQLCYPDPAHAIQASDFFAGSSPRSF
mmetsp:Transcript_19163/g.52614  ORF Transcript_19163/g.52614 Transcript_19163/m.52614 type:complete len:1091 (+) Transcript_19163:116-3388(+)